MIAPPALTFASRQGRWVLVATILGSGIAGLTATVVNVALPTIGRDLDTGTAGLQWILNGYLLPLAALILLGGSLGDRFGRRRIFLLGVVWFAVASLACGLAPDITTLVAARALQGVGGALLVPGSLAIIQSSFAPGERARAIGAWSGFGGVATAIGPLLGGYLVQQGSWRWVFLLNLPLAVAVVIIARRHVPESVDPTATGEVDLAGGLLGAAGLGGVTYALIEAPGRGATSAVVVTAAVVGVVALLGFGAAERRGRHPMLPLDIFSNRQFSGANFMTLAMYAALGGMLFLLATYLQTALAYSPVESGLALMPVTLLMLALSARAGALATRIGPRLPMTVGPLVVGAGLALMARIQPGAGYQATVLPAVVVFGLGLALTVAPLTATVLAAADERHAGVASGVNNAVARVAQLLAVAGLPVLAGITGDDFTDPVAFASGFRTAAFVTAGLAAMAAAVSWLTISNDVLAEGPGEPGGAPAPGDEHYHCAAEGPPLRPAAHGATSLCVEARRAAAALAELDVVLPAGDVALLDRYGAGDAKCGTGRPCPTVTLSRQDRCWVVSGRDIRARLADSKGLRYLAELLRSPGVERHVLDLVDRVEGVASDQPGLDRHHLGDAGELVDGRARTAYRHRIEALRAEIGDALETGAEGHAEVLQTELDQLVGQLAAAFGLGGRSRKASSASERARLNVTRALRAATARLRAALPEEATMLDRRLRTGLYCVYEPGDDEVRWVVQS